jgi:membrane-associated phospholipid phosphatase
MTQSCPNSPDFLTNPDPFEAFMVFISVVPYFLGLVICMKFLVTRTARGSLLFIMLVVQNAIGETIKNFIMQVRPEGACSKSFGMPSSHSAFITSLATWLLLEEMGFEKWVVFKDTPWRKIMNILCWAIAPFVCYSRYYLGYHTVQQISWGVLMGVVNAILLFFYVRNASRAAERSRFTGKLPLVYKIWDFAMIKVDMHQELFYVRHFHGNFSEKPKPSKQVEQLARAFSEVNSIKNDLQKQKIFLNQQMSGISGVLGHENELPSKTNGQSKKNS